MNGKNILKEKVFHIHGKKFKTEFEIERTKAYIMLRNRFKANGLETCLAIFTFLSLLLYIFILFDFLSSATIGNPFKEYYSNSGIKVIYAISLCARILFITTFLLLAFNEKRNYLISATYLISAFAIGFLQWFELYYGSTFYYGEVRDKQGLSFPFLASLMLTLIIWKIRFSRKDRVNLNVQITLSVIVNIGLFALWEFVCEPWNIYQS